MEKFKLLQQRLQWEIHKQNIRIQQRIDEEYCRMSTSTSSPDTDDAGIKSRLPADCLSSISMPKNWDQVEKLKNLKEKLQQEIASVSRSETERGFSYIRETDDENVKSKITAQKSSKEEQDNVMLFNKQSGTQNPSLASENTDRLTKYQQDYPGMFRDANHELSQTSYQGKCGQNSNESNSLSSLKLFPNRYESERVTVPESSSSRIPNIHNVESKNSDSINLMTVDKLNQSLLDADACYNDIHKEKTLYAAVTTHGKPWQKVKYIVPKNIIQPVDLNPKVMIEPLKLHGNTDVPSCKRKTEKSVKNGKASKNFEMPQKDDRSKIKPEKRVKSQSDDVGNQSLGFNDWNINKPTNGSKTGGDKLTVSMASYQASGDKSENLVPSFVHEQLNEVPNNTVSPLESHKLGNSPQDSTDEIYGNISNSDSLDKQSEIAKLKMLYYSKEMLGNRHQMILNKWTSDINRFGLGNQKSEASQKTDTQSKASQKPDIQFNNRKSKSYVIKSPKLAKKIPGRGKKENDRSKSSYPVSLPKGNLSVENRKPSKAVNGLKSDTNDMKTSKMVTVQICEDKGNNIGTEKNHSGNSKKIAQENKTLAHFTKTEGNSLAINTNCPIEESKSVNNTEHLKSVCKTAEVTVQDKDINSSDKLHEKQKSKITNELQMKQYAEKQSEETNVRAVMPNNITKVSGETSLQEADGSTVLEKRDTMERLKVKINSSKPQTAESEMKNQMPNAMKIPNKTLFQNACSAVAAKSKLATGIPKSNKVNITVNTVPNFLRNDAIKTSLLNNNVTICLQPLATKGVAQYAIIEDQTKDLPEINFLTNSQVKSVSNSVFSTGSYGLQANHALPSSFIVVSSAVTLVPLSTSVFTNPSFAPQPLNTGQHVRAIPGTPKNVYSVTVASSSQNLSGHVSNFVPMTRPVILPGAFPWIHAPVTTIQNAGISMSTNPLRFSHTVASNCANTYLSTAGASTVNVYTGNTGLKHKPALPVSYAVRALQPKSSSSCKIITPVFSDVSGSGIQVLEPASVPKISSAVKRPVEPIVLVPKKTRVKTNTVQVSKDGHTVTVTQRQNDEHERTSDTMEKSVDKDKNNHTSKKYKFVNLKTALSLYDNQDTDSEKNCVPICNDSTADTLFSKSDKAQCLSSGEKTTSGSEKQKENSTLSSETQLNITKTDTCVQDVRPILKDKKYRFHSGKPRDEETLNNKQNDTVRNSNENLPLQSTDDHSSVMVTQSASGFNTFLPETISWVADNPNQCVTSTHLPRMLIENDVSEILNTSGNTIKTHVSGLDMTGVEKSSDVKPGDDESNLELFEQFKIKPYTPVFDMSRYLVCDSEPTESFKEVLDLLPKTDNYKNNEPTKSFQEVLDSVPRIENYFSLAGTAMDHPEAFQIHSNQSAIDIEKSILGNEKAGLERTNELESHDVNRVVNVTVESDRLPDQISLINIPTTSTANSKDNQRLSEQELIEYLCSTNNEKTKLILLNGNVCDSWEKLKNDIGAEDMSDPEFLHHLLTTAEKKQVKAAEKRDTGSQTIGTSVEFSPDPEEVESLNLKSGSKQRQDSEKTPENFRSESPEVIVVDDDSREYEVAAPSSSTDKFKTLEMENQLSYIARWNTTFDLNSPDFHAKHPEQEMDLNNNKSQLDHNNNSEIDHNNNSEVVHKKNLDCNNNSEAGLTRLERDDNNNRVKAQITVAIDQIIPVEPNTDKKEGMMKAGMKRPASIPLESQAEGMITAKRISGLGNSQCATTSNDSTEIGPINPTLAELLRSTAKQTVKTEKSDSMPLDEQASLMETEPKPESVPITSSTDDSDALLQKFYCDFKYNIPQKKDMDWHITNFRDFIKNRGYSQDFEHKSSEWLNNQLIRFYLSRATLHSKYVICAISLHACRMYLCNYVTWLSDCRVNILEDQVFKKSNEVYDIVCEMDSGFVPCHKTTPVFTKDDDEKLRNSGVLSTKTPVKLLWKVYFDINYHLGEDGFSKDFLHGLKKDSLIFDSDEKGNYCTFRDDCWPTPWFKKTKMYEESTGYPACPVRTIKFYLSKLSKSEALFQYPRYVYAYTGEWYNKVPLSKIKLYNLMKEISKAAELSYTYSLPSIGLLAKKHKFLKELKKTFTDEQKSVCYNTD